MMQSFLLVGIGGFFGSGLRFLCSSLILTLIPQATFPLGTITVNILGSMLVGILISVISSNTMIFMAVIGFCGGFTTFSAFSLEVVRMIKTGNWINAFGYASISLIICILASFLGMWIGEKLITK